MSDTLQPFVVWRPKDRPGKFILIVPDSENHNLSPNYGELTEQELRRLLAIKYGKNPSEIEALMQQARATPEFIVP